MRKTLFIFFAAVLPFCLQAQCDTTGMAAQSRQAYALFQAGRFDESQASATALQLRQRQCLGDTASALLATYTLLGNIFFEKGLYPRASEQYQQALALPCTKRNRSQEANLSNRIGSSCLYSGEYDRAIKYMEAALLIQQEILPQGHPDIGKTYIAIGTYWKVLRRTEDASHFFEKALDIALQYGKDSSLTAYCYSEAGQAWLALKKPEKALDYFLREDQIMLADGNEKHPVYAYTCHDLGRVYAQLGRHEEALVKEKQALALIQSGTKTTNPLISTLQLYVGRAYLALGRYQEAIDLFEADKATLTQFHGEDFAALFHSEAGLGNAYYRWHLHDGDDARLAQSRQYFARAAFHLERSIRFEANTVRRRKRLYDALGVFEAAIAVENYTSRTKKDATAVENAWQLSEMLHGYTLLASAQESEAQHYASVPDSLLQVEKKLKKNLLALEGQRFDLLGKRGLAPTDPQVLQLNQTYLKEQDDYTAFCNNLETAYPAYFQLKYAIQMASLSDTRRRLGPQQCLLEYLVGDSSLFAFVVRSDTALLFQFPMNFPLSNWVADMRTGIGDYHARTGTASYEATVRRYADAATKLYDKIVAPIEPFLRKEVIIVPDGDLHALPFDALLTAAPADPGNFKTYPFWLHQHDISAAYSATALASSRKNGTTGHPLKTLLAFAPFGEEGDTYSVASLRDASYPPLPFSLKEAQNAVEIMGGSSKLLSGAAASKANFEELAGGYDILHLATHAQANSKNGAYSLLAFCPDTTKGTAASPFVRSGELYAYALQAQLVVLSACETGLGEVQRGEGVLSLAQAFSYAGAKSVLTTLWRVNDRSTMQVMEYFYLSLKKGTPKGKALMEAKRQYLRNNPGRGAHPFFWSGFVLFGDAGEG